MEHRRLGIVAGIAGGLAAGSRSGPRRPRRPRSRSCAASGPRSSRRCSEAEERERARVAQALHDDALQSLLAAHQDLIEAAPGRAQVTRAHEIMGDAIDRVRDAVAALHPVILEQRGLEAGARGRLPAGRAPGRIRVRARGRARGAVGDHDGLVFSVARELVTNAARHAGAEPPAGRGRRRPGEICRPWPTTAAGSSPAAATRRSTRATWGWRRSSSALEATGGALEIETLGGERHPRGRAHPDGLRGRRGSARGGIRTRNALRGSGF